MNFSVPPWSILLCHNRPQLWRTGFDLKIHCLQPVIAAYIGYDVSTFY
jgi:hypothetical protein